MTFMDLICGFLDRGREVDPALWCARSPNYNAQNDIHKFHIVKILIIPKTINSRRKKSKNP